MNHFYKQPKIFQWIEATLLLIIGFLPVTAIFEIGYSQPQFYLLIIIYVPVIQFAFTPFFKLIGVYRYYSPMLLGYMANDRQIDLHSGGSFDYLFAMRKYKAGIELRNALLMYHLQGLLSIIQLMENKNIPEKVNIIGTSYFFNNRTLSKFGFEIVNPSLFYRLNLFVNFIDLFWMYSLSQGKCSIPKIWNTQKASITGIKLVESKNRLKVIYDKMKIKHSFAR